MFFCLKLKADLTNSGAASTSGAGVSSGLVVFGQNHCAPHVDLRSFVEVLPIVLLSPVTSS